MTERKMGDAYDLPLVMGAALLLNGGFFDESVAIVGAVVVLCLFVRTLQRKAFIRRDQRILFLIPWAILVMAAAVSFWAVDSMENWMGVLRLGVLLLWMWLVRCKGKESKTALKTVPVLGCIMATVSSAGYFIPALRLMLWENVRMAGFFQYSNTCALFFVLGLICLTYEPREKEKGWVRIVELVLLLYGLLMTGSRSMLLIFLLWGVCYAVRSREARKPALITGAALLLGAGSYVLISGNSQNVGRIFTMFQSNSTLWGRLLYDRDALLVILKKFFGLGRMGYYYSQGTFQSGVYHIRFVHNDFLQMALDYGVIPLILLLVFLVWQIWKGGQGRVEKEILLVICLSSLVDFHCQYLLILFVAALCLDYGQGKEEQEADVRENYFLLPILFVFFAYIGIAAGFSRAGNQEMALSMLSDYTNAQEKEMARLRGSEESYALANEVIRRNPYNIKAFVTRGTFYASRLQVEGFIADFDRVIELDPYNVDYYASYEKMLRMMEEQLMGLASSGQGEEQYEDTLAMVRERLRSLPEQLSDMEERTSWLAYKIKDKPVFTYGQNQKEVE